MQPATNMHRAAMNRKSLKRRALAATGEWMESHAMCLACGWQCVIAYQRPAERWTCTECGKRELVRDDGEESRPARHYPEEGEA
jgi:predicted RNA-binding Zn-ribbon protein involved in translation (DUF1610 family)